ncbi:phage tail assembly chaperone family protein, TAC [Moraxella bovis]|uniref:phage tail assembly chaperone family protein, TAC n=1 Tax=Moraxella bovis TaxID=476 RepID=UPI00227A1FB9|nr:phage tail assembly chaperone family protein, TAC [Moraxella bovis]WAJ74574.1 phage tail assembly chaperone family protein, TAC [Moraxella bovis]WAJ74827.1 phage tail assembly chaperone family protein, TAC [Moraxella bovis]
MSKATLATALLAGLSAINEPKKINIADFNGDIYIRQITVGEQEQIAKHLEKEKGNNMALSFIFGVCDEKGNRLFTIDDLDKISQINFKAMLPIIKEINKLNGLDIDSETQEKNS